MSERLSAIYQAKPVCVYELVDENHQYIEETRSELRMASQAGQLCYPDIRVNECGEIYEDFIHEYDERVIIEKTGFRKVLRIPVEDGIDEIELRVNSWDWRA